MLRKAEAANLVLRFVTMTKFQAVLTGAIVVGGVALSFWAQRQSQAALQAENAALQQHVAQLEAENESRTNSADATNHSMTDEQLRELLRLRNEVGMLRQRTNELDKLRQEVSRLRAAPANPPPTPPAATEDAEAQAGALARMNDAKQSCLGLFLFAADNQNQFPAQLNQLTPYLKGALTGTNDFELLYQGGLGGFTNPATTASTIILRERTARPTANGGWTKTYGFADGHAELHLEPTGNFDAWESQRLPPAASAPPSQ